MTKSLRDTAQALLANWDTPEWNKLSKRAELMAELRAALMDHTPSSNVAPSDKELLDALADNHWDLRSVSVPTGAGDADVDCVVIEHHMAEPQERDVAMAHRDDPRAAIRRAIRESDKNAERCVSCGNVLHDGDSVYYEHSEGGHIHYTCASDDPRDFVDEDEAPLKKGASIPEPFAFNSEGRANA